MNEWLESLAVYFKRPLIVVLILGFSSGLPLALTFSTLSVWMAEEGVDLTTIGIFVLVGTPYTLKFLWAPLIDRAALPPFTSWLGQRRGWMVATQLAMMAALLALGASDPVSAPYLTALAAVVVSFLSATQDIVIDAYRIESVEEGDQGAGAAMIVFGYRIGMLVSGAGALLLADQMSWMATYVVMAALMLVGMTTILSSPEPPRPALEPLEGLSRVERAQRWVFGAVFQPFLEFMQRQGWIAILVFILLYKLGDAFAGAMANPFYVDLGFTKTEIASVTKAFGLASTLAGLFLGGLLVSRMPILWALVICGILQAASNLMFAVQAAVGDDIAVLSVTVAVENVTGGMGTAAFVAYMSRLTNIAFTATQYALLSSFMAVGRTFLSSGSGFSADSLGWVGFFIASAFVAIPGLVMLFWMMRALPAHADRPPSAAQT